MRDDFVNVLLVCINGQNTPRILGLFESFTGSFLSCKFTRRLEKRELEDFGKVMDQLPCFWLVILDTMFSKVVCQTDESNAQRTTCKGALLGSLDRIVLIVNQLFQTPYSKVTEFFQIFQLLQFTDVNGRQNAQSNLTMTIDVLNRISGECNLLTQVTHIHLIIKRTVRVTVVDVHDVQTTSLCTFLQKVQNEFLSSDSLSWNRCISFITHI